MVKKIVSADRLAALLLLNKVYEITPQPYRMQPKLQLIIGISEYVEFCEWIKDSYILSTETNTIISAISKYRLGTGNEELFCMFAKDVAYAQIKELMYACEYGKGATKIVPQYDGSEHKLEISNYKEDWLHSLEDSIEEIDEYLYYRSYDHSVKSLLEEGLNPVLLKEAVHLYHFSQMGIPASFI